MEDQKMKYFEFFGIEPSFFVDEENLRRQFLRNSKKYHPDFFSLEDEEKQSEVLELSTYNNNAYKTLSSFESRMEYIIKEHGLLNEEGNQSIPQIFLMEMMEINESIMELEFDFDEKTFEVALESTKKLEEGLLEEINPILKNYSYSAPGEIEKVKEFYLKKKYLWRIHENLNKFAPASPKGATL